MSFYTATFEFPFKFHPVKPAEDSDALEFSLGKFTLIPVVKKRLFSM